MSQAIVIQPPNSLDYVTAVANTNVASSTKARYIKALDNFIAHGGSFGNALALRQYAASLNPSAQRHLKSAITAVCKHYLFVLKNADSHNPNAIRRFEGLMEAVQVNDGATKPTEHIWLSLVEQEKMLLAPDVATLAGQRDALLIRFMLATGLRREEVAAVLFDNLKYVDGHCILSIVGKGKKARSIPLDGRLCERIEAWRERVGDGRIFRSVDRHGNLGDSLDATAVFRVVRKYGRLIGKGDLAPHDMRRTFAENLRRAKIDIVDISNLLGHSSIETTMRYLNIKLNLNIVPGALLPV